MRDSSLWVDMDYRGYELAYDVPETITDDEEFNEDTVFFIYSSNGELMETFPLMDFMHDCNDIEEAVEKVRKAFKEEVDFYIEDTDDDGWYNSDDWTKSSVNYDYTMPEKMSKEEEAKMVESLCKSDTIVFHKEDSSTDMLKPIYEGRGWDVYTGTTYNGLSIESVHELIKRHDKILFLGHGTPSGLIGGNMTYQEIPLIKDKKVFALWCYAATFFKRNGCEGKGIFCSDNAPSEVWECKAACGANVSADWILNNMYYLSDCIKDVIDLAFEDPNEACRRAKEAYSKAEASTADEKKVVKFNTDTLQVV